MPTTPRQPDEIRFCLDENLSYKVAEALRVVGVPLLHVSRVPGLGGAKAGQSGADDATVAKWCSATGYVLITCDNDFRAKWVRSGLLASLGVETIVFGWQPRGAKEQHRLITGFYDKWTDQLKHHTAGHRVWLQPKRGRLKVQGRQTQN